MDTQKPKRKMTDWAAFCSKYWSDNKAKFNNSYRDMLKSQELKDAYKKSKEAPVAGGKLKRGKKMMC